MIASVGQCWKAIVSMAKCRTSGSECGTEQDSDSGQLGGGKVMMDSGSAAAYLY